MYCLFKYIDSKRFRNTHAIIHKGHYVKNLGLATVQCHLTHVNKNNEYEVKEDQSAA